VIRVTIWNEYRHEREDSAIGAIYPEGIHAAIAAGLEGQPDFKLRTATLDEPEHGLSVDVLAATDVLIWWGHKAHEQVADEIVDRVQTRVLDGMGLIVLHSAHMSRIFRRLVGTSGQLKWREANDQERLWVVAPGHQIAQGLGEFVEIEREEMYGEYFDIPAPDALVFVSWFSGGEVFRSGCCFERGAGSIFYFRPGHESYPTYYNRDVLRVIANAIRWAAPTTGPVPHYGNVQPLEPLDRRQ
jgi:trehalose utilization protein